MKHLVHKGLLIPQRYVGHGLDIRIEERLHELTPEQEEMAVAWVKKLETEYVKDPAFTKNFFSDFSAKLGFEKPLDPKKVDFSEVLQFVERERERKATMSREDKKRAMEDRKALREANKQLYGCAVVDDIAVEIGNYIAEPSSIFMGRGKHPKRGRWKEGPNEEDIELNLSPDAPVPAGRWSAVLWQPDSMWIARWRDKLSGKMKYVWLSDSAIMKQRKEIEKFNLARELDLRLEEVRAHIGEGLETSAEARRRIATVCYLVDQLMFRVGDEENEAGTVGASTLKPEHVIVNKSDGTTTFNFLGKDSIRFEKTVTLPEVVTLNLEEFKEKSKSTIFKGVRSKPVSDFLGEVMPGLTAKVFRTHHATRSVDSYLKETKLDSSEPDYMKKNVATTANLQAAILCNHKRKIPKTWKSSLEKKQERLKNLKSQEKKTQRTLEGLDKLRLKIEETKATRDYNLGTSLKSYIDPRVYYEWGLKIDYDWKNYYPKTLQRKFSWVEKPESSE
jgi:DNA topoisomerase-1